MEEKEQAPPLVWWKEKKLVAGILLVVVSFVLGFYGKILIVAKYYEPIEVITGFSVWAFSWVLLFFGAFLVGRETVILVQKKIQSQMKETAMATYEYTRKIPKKSYDQMMKTSKSIKDRMGKKK